MPLASFCSPEVWILNSKKFVLFFLRESYFQQWEYFSRHFYRIIHLVSFGNELDQYPLSIDHFLLLASTMSSTDSASVFAILRSQKMNLKHNLRPMLELESGSNDPMAYMLTIVLIQFIQSDGMGTGNIIGSFIIQFLVGAAAGYILGKLAILILNKINIDNQSLYPILLLSLYSSLLPSPICFAVMGIWLYTLPA